MGNRYIRRLLYLGAISQIMVRSRCGARQDWLSDMLSRKKTKVAGIALAHRTARTIFDVLRDGSRYQPQATTA
jgi:transposase